MKMNCLVEDKINSNLPPPCCPPACGEGQPQSYGVDLSVSYRFIVKECPSCSDYSGSQELNNNNCVPQTVGDSAHVAGCTRCLGYFHLKHSHPGIHGQVVSHVVTRCGCVGLKQSEPSILGQDVVNHVVPSCGRAGRNKELDTEAVFHSQGFSNCYEEVSSRGGCGQFLSSKDVGSSDTTQTASCHSHTQYEHSPCTSDKLSQHSPCTSDKLLQHSSEIPPPASTNMNIEMRISPSTDTSPPHLTSSSSIGIDTTSHKTDSSRNKKLKNENVTLFDQKYQVAHVRTVSGDDVQTAWSRFESWDHASKMIKHNKYSFIKQPRFVPSYHRQTIRPLEISRNFAPTSDPRAGFCGSSYFAPTSDPGAGCRGSGRRTTGCFLSMGDPLSFVAQEEFADLVSVGQEQGDLTAEVVYSLRFRDYLIGELLGKGISSTVRRVTQKSTGVEYAVKIIDISGEKSELAQVDQVKKDTVREIQILRMCAGHPNIIELHDVFETPTFIFLVFEICKKGELFDYLTSVVSLSEKRTRIFMRQLLEAVAFVHEKNIVHRDLKPENVLLDDNLNIKLSDFGFATVLKPGEELSELCGTPGYLAPEVLAHSMYESVPGYGKEVDMWACGVIMYTLLCGAPPFWNRRQMMMLRAIMAADYTFNSPEWDDITETPKSLIRKLLLVNPKERLTAKQALEHPFFQSLLTQARRFNGRRKFRAAVKGVMFHLRLIYFSKHAVPISLDVIRSNPYCIKVMRKVIDSCAFGMYKHWVKRVDNQNRAALFEHTLRDDWRHALMSSDSIHTF